MGPIRIGPFGFLGGASPGFDQTRPRPGRCPSLFQLIDPYACFSLVHNQYLNKFTLPSTGFKTHVEGEFYSTLTLVHNLYDGRDCGFCPAILILCIYQMSVLGTNMLNLMNILVYYCIYFS